ncbi:hypothetical protein TWF696_007145 [Orbilia brochopaga]|uniref:Uncharacterized protein n=1 Tax=Orbilia brochopaga TaxID=3140254 RepID=A0AAV9UUC7_9PEZI
MDPSQQSPPATPKVDASSSYLEIYPRPPSVGELYSKLQRRLSLPSISTSARLSSQLTAVHVSSPESGSASYRRRGLEQQSEPPASSTTVDDFMNRWKVVSSEPLAEEAAGTSLEKLTTIEQNSPFQSYHVTSGVGLRIAGASTMPPGFENGHAPEESSLLKRKHSSISTTASPSDGEIASAPANEPSIPGLPLVIGPPISISPASEDIVSSNGIITGTLSWGTFQPLDNANPTSGRTSSQTPESSALQVASSDISLKASSAPPSTQVASQTNIESPMSARNLDPDSIKSALRSSRSPRPTGNSRSCTPQSPATSGSSALDSTCHLNPNDEVKKIVKHADVDTLYNLPTFNLILARLKSDVYPDGSSPGFSYLHETTLSENALSKEDLYEQQETSQNKGRSATSISKKLDRDSSTKVAEQPAPRCSRHHTKDPQPDGTEDGCDSDCFEEYDPFDDVEELREAIRRSEAAGSNVTAPKDQPSQTSSERRPSKSTEKVDTSRRRPYLDRRAKASSRRLEPETRPGLLGGSRLHLSFSEPEARHIWLTAYLACPDFITAGFSVEAGICALREFLCSPKYAGEEKRAAVDAIIADALLKLPGRTARDVRGYMADVMNSKMDPALNQEITLQHQRPLDRLASWSWSTLAFARSLDYGWSRTSFPKSHAEVRFIQFQKSLRFLQPFRVFAEGSSDVVDCAWDETGENFALGCTTYSDMYNRPGNLMLGDTKGNIKFMCGHKTTRPPNQGNEAILDPFLHSTVSSVDFSNGLLYSGSYDSTVKIWDVKEKRLRKSLRFSAPIARMKMNNKFKNTGAACLQNGDLVIFRHSDLDGDGKGSDTSQVFSATNERFEGSSVLWTNSKARNGWVFVSYDNKESDRRELTAYTGDLRVFDAVRGAEVGSIKPGSTRQLDICLDESEQLLVAGAVSGPVRTLSPDTFSHVRVWDLRATFRRILEFGCKHKDINKVTISRCQSYITSSGTNGKSYMWDIRYGSDPLHVLEHGESKTPLSPDRDREDADTGVTFASWATGDGSLFVTGSSDGLVKVWDPKRADPFLYNLAELDDPVMSGAFSPDGDALVIGETTGKATLLSHAGRHGPPENFVQDRSMLAPTASEAEEGGVERARWLLRTGQVVLVYEDGGRPAVYGR